MLWLIILFISIIDLQTVGVEHCCKILVVFDEKYYRQCGFKSFETIDKSEHIPALQSDPNCAKYHCVLEKNKLIANGAIDYNDLAQYLDNYAKLYPNYTHRANFAKSVCTPVNLSPNSTDDGVLCDASLLTACLMSTLFADCPGWKPSTQCQQLMDHMDQCALVLLHKFEKEAAEAAEKKKIEDFEKIRASNIDYYNE